VDARCVVDPCFGLSCPLTAEGWIQLCRDGECVPSCALRQCPPDELCVDGRCEVDPCLGVECAEGQVCYDARCVNQCGECAEGTICLLGACRTDPCETARCAPAERCVLDHRGNAQCETDPDYMGQPTPPPLDAGVPDAAPPPPDAAIPDAAPPPPPPDAELDAAIADAAAPPTQTGGDDGGCDSVSNGGEGGAAGALLAVLFVGLRRRRSSA
jgi:uncharacterized protein (TIGR03382 family)